MSDAPIVQLTGIRKNYETVEALSNIDLDIHHGQIVVLLGPSGSGKTTLLSILGGFVQPSSGHVRIDGEDFTGVPPARRPTVTVFQDYALFPHMTVLENVAFGLAMRRVSKAERRRRSEEILTTVGLEGLGQRKVQQLSGGQRQRVALARAIVVEPKVLLLDEPLGALDLKIRRQMQDELVEIQRRINTTFVHVTHDQEEAMNIADVVVVMSNGKIEDYGSPERVYLKPATLFTATFMGDTNILKGHVSQVNDGEAKVETAIGPVVAKGAVKNSSDVHLSIRPEQLHLGPSETNGFVSLGQVRIVSSTFQGPNRLCTADSVTDPSVRWIVRQPPESTVGPKDLVELWTKQDDVVLLSE